MLKSEGRDLANCSVISEPVQSSSDLKYELRYDEELLVEGKDYCVKYDGGTEGVGYAEYCFVGIGDYYGETNSYFTIYHEDMDDYGFIEQDYEYANPLTEAEESLFPEYEIDDHGRAHLLPVREGGREPVRHDALPEGAGHRPDLYFP